MATVIWWIRRDLRLGDNQALTAAMKSAGEDLGKVIPLFILDPKLLASPFVGERRTAFLFAGLRALDTDLRARGGRLVIRQGRPAEVLAQICHETGAGEVFAERDYSPYAKQRDDAVAATPGFTLRLTGGVSVHAPAEVLKDDGSPYTVYTPYSRRWRALGEVRRSDILPAPVRIDTPAELASLPLPDAPTWSDSIPFIPGETEGRRRLAAFVKGDSPAVYGYANHRNRPDLDGTSQLSPFLRFGMISPRLAVLAAYTALDAAPNAEAAKGADVWLSELIWREFYISILHHFPHVRRGAFRPEFDAIPWHNDENEFAAWCTGRTGYPIVDAAMRQLTATGWMHNRARMIVASFLVKDLLVDWRWGERWFMQQLLDGDPAANNGGWQWTAGVGTDAAPYFRIFNPVAQGEKFDPAGDFVRRWVPELARVPATHVHQPWTLSRSEQLQADCLIGRDYPAPIVDHSAARTRVLAAFGAVKRP
jgi:deoxyribodipyrimidine photo-lyase